MRSAAMSVQEGQIDHGVLAVIEAAVIGIGEFRLGRGLERVGVRRVRYDPDGAAHGARAVERALRAAQHLDTIEIVEIGRNDDLALVGRGRRRQGCLVEIEADRRGVAAVGGDAPHLELRHAGTAGADRDAGDGLHEGG